MEDTRIFAFGEMMVDATISTELLVTKRGSFFTLDNDRVLWATSGLVVLLWSQVIDTFVLKATQFTKIAKFFNVTGRLPGAK